MHVNILVLNGAYASSVAITLDMLSAAAQVASSLNLPSPHYRVFGIDQHVRLSNGMRLDVLPLRRLPHLDGKQGWIVPGLGWDNAQAIRSRLAQHDAQQASRLLARSVDAGVPLLASCTATLLLAQSGVLKNKKVTTTWWLAHEIKRIEPSCQIDVNRLIVRDGLITTAGAALAQADLMLHFLKDSHGLQLAQGVARVMLIDQRESQAPYIVPSAYVSGNELLSQIARRIEKALPAALSMEQLAKEFSVSTRTLARHVKAATGSSPLALMQSVRIHKAQALLKGSRLSVDEIAARVGYTDATALRRLLKKTIRATPRQLRQVNAL
jgi:transcriptional regulator GlxA family with amidase domain